MSDKHDDRPLYEPGVKPPPGGWREPDDDDGPLSRAAALDAIRNVLHDKSLSDAEKVMRVSELVQESAMRGTMWA